jgi:hypothetical protein
MRSHVFPTTCPPRGRLNPTGTECTTGHEDSSAHVFIAHNDKGSCGHGDADNYVDKCIANSDVLEAAAATAGVSGGESMAALFQNNRQTDGKALLGLVIATKEAGCCPSGRMRLINSEVTSASCYTDFWAFQCVPACVSSCCAATTTETITFTKTSATSSTVTTSTVTASVTRTVARRTSRSPP